VDSNPATISVVIPAYNAAAYLAEAVNSVRAQTRPPLEIVIVDDGSTDETAAIANGFGGEVRYTHQANAGPAAALNHGLSLARGRLVAFISADDLWVADKLERQMRALAESGPGTLVFGFLQHFVSPELSEEEAARLKAPPDPMPAFAAGTMLAEREAFATVGLFNPAFRSGEFLDWYGRAIDLGYRARMLKEVVLRRRVHGENHSLKSKAPVHYTRVLKAALDRRRQAGR
jgi:glycosyltransferase involved in cell wall biosynthesis